jgi:hypothetical protein
VSATLRWYENIPPRFGGRNASDYPGHGRWPGPDYGEKEPTKETPKKEPEEQEPTPNAPEATEPATEPVSVKEDKKTPQLTNAPHNPWEVLAVGALVAVTAAAWASPIPGDEIIATSLLTSAMAIFA